MRALKCRNVLNVTRNLTKNQRFYCSWDSKAIERRNVYVIDHQFSLEHWIQTSQKPGLFRSPVSGHINSKYLLTLFETSNYHFSSHGEYSLSVSAAFPVSPKLDSSSSPEKHSLLVFPEGIFIKNVSVNDIPVVVKLISSNCALKIDTLKSLLSSSVILENIEDMTIISSLSKYSSSKISLQVLKWFEEADSLINNGKDPSIKPTTRFLLSSEQQNHHSGASVVVFPFNDSFDSLDSFDRVKKVVEKYTHSK